MSLRSERHVTFPRRGFEGRKLQRGSFVVTFRGHVVKRLHGCRLSCTILWVYLTKKDVHITCLATPKGSKEFERDADCLEKDF